MLKVHERSFAYLQKLTDFTLSFLIWLAVYGVRFYLFPGAQTGLGWNFFRVGFVIGTVTIFVFSRQGLYKSYRLKSRYDELKEVVKANALANVSFVTLLYLLAEERLSRGVVVGYFVVSSLGFVLLRAMVRQILSNLRRSGKNLRHILLIGDGKAIEQYVANLRSFEESGVRFKGWIDSRGLAKKYDIKELSFQSLQGEDRVRPDNIVIGYQGEGVANIDGVLKKVYNDVVPIILLPDLTYSIVGYQVDQFAGVPALIVNQPKFSTLDVFLKRAFDIILSGTGLVLLSPFLFVVGTLVKISSKGPIFYGQERIGLDGKRFKMWKFRSMRMDVPSGGGSSTPGWTVANDPRRTKIGTFLRSTSIDELPQLWNVLVGDMSLVGPRPEQPYFVERFRHEIPAYMLRHKMKAGITGWAQINGWRGDTSLHKRIECDLYYIRNWSLWLDIEIIVKTLWKGFYNKNAY